MAEAVYVLSALTSLACAVLLLRGYVHNPVRLLLWSGLCFVGLTVSNAVLFLDLVVFPDIDLSLWRGLPALFGLALLLFGMVLDAE